MDYEWGIMSCELGLRSRIKIESQDQGSKLSQDSVIRSFNSMIYSFKHSLIHKKRPGNAGLFL